MKIFKKDNYRVPVFSWCADIEESAQKQIDNLARLPFVVGQIAIMPDCHMGYGMPIGGVIACDNVVIPNAVGVDIGCGMLAVKTDLMAIDREVLKKVMDNIRRRIPVGFEWHQSPVAPLHEPIDDGFLPVISEQLDKARLQLGTLGGGNHFIEIQQDAAGHIWFMVHSGSRNLGKTVADHYNKFAKKMNAAWYSSVPSNWDLAFLPLTEPEFHSYVQEMAYAVRFAQQNREVMAEQIRIAFTEEVKGPFEFAPPINIAHNYAAWGNIRGQTVIVHRKGATSARSGEIGIIPGSQGSASYIVEGLGNAKSFNSCSHGAGRKMGRKEAQRKLDLQGERERLDRLNIIHSLESTEDLDEAPGAYKDIDSVMDNQQDLVKILTKLTPLAVLKG